MVEKPALREWTKPKPFVTTTQGMRGWFAVLIHWNDDAGGFWEPLQTGIGSYASIDGAIREGQDWAAAEDIEFRRTMP